MFRTRPLQTDETVLFKCEFSSCKAGADGHGFHLHQMRYQVMTLLRLPLFSCLRIDILQDSPLLFEAILHQRRGDRPVSPLQGAAPGR